MHSQWHVPDLIDLEYFLSQYAGDEPAAKTAMPSDRRIFLSYAASHPGPLLRRDLLKYWLDQQREKEHQDKDGPAGLPGDAFSESFRIVRMMLIVFGLVFGASLAWSILSYHGTDPINVFSFLWGLIIPQILLLILLMLSFALRGMGLSDSVTAPYPLLASVIRRLAVKLKKAGETALSAERESRIRAVSGLIGRQKTLYGAVFFWPVFNLFQFFGVCFNIGVLSATLIKVTITDLAFGWQSTLQPAPETVFKIIDFFARPWSWFIPSPISHPGIGQIEGSKMVLKEGMARLSTLDLVSWWPFLCLAVLFYGLLPRLILLITGTFLQYRLLGKIDFTHSACDRLVRRMQTPEMATQSRPFSSPQMPMEIPPASIPVFSESMAFVEEPVPPAILFVPEDMDGRISDDDLKDRVLMVLRFRVSGMIRSALDFAKDTDAVKHFLSGPEPASSLTRVVILQEAWLPPIRETLSWIKHLRSVIGKKTGIIIALIGKPSGSQVFASPRDTDLLIWQRAVDSLGDPYIRTENLGG